MNTKHPFETVEAGADVMKLAEMILSDCGQSTVISDRLQRRVAGRIQQHMDSALVGHQQVLAALKNLKEAVEYTTLGIRGLAAVRQAAEAIAAAEQAQQRCEYCDGTGDVPGPIGVWRGVCKCEAVQQAQQAEPVALDVIAKLVALTRAVSIAMDDSEERDGADGCEYVIDRVNFDAVCNALDALEELPDNRPGWAMSAADKAAWALRHLTDAAPQAAPQSAALADIAAERRRQMEVEGWTPEHDDAHSDGQMATAAACYAISAHSQLRYKQIIMPSWWPWDSTWWKPSTARRDLVKAGALIAAEIERIDRAAQKGGA